MVLGGVLLRGVGEAMEGWTTYDERSCWSVAFEELLLEELLLEHRFGRFELD